MSSSPERVFQDAFSLPDPVPALLDLLKACPQPESVDDFLYGYGDAAKETPRKAGEYAKTLIAVINNDDAPYNAANLEDPSNEDFVALTYEHLSEVHRQHFSLSDSKEPFGPTNSFLIASYISGLSLKHDLTRCSVQLAYITDGLDVELAAPDAQVLVVAACLSLLEAGSKIVATSPGGTYLKSAEEVATKLEAKKAGGAVTDENALLLLERTISHAKSGFKPENDVDDAWTLLFPFSGRA